LNDRTIPQAPGIPFTGSERLKPQMNIEEHDKQRQDTTNYPSHRGGTNITENSRLEQKLNKLG
jgi:hypothetical protein